MLEPGVRDRPGNDWELLQTAARGDEDSFRLLVETHQARLVRLCHRLLGNRDEALDAAQEVFLIAYRKAGSLEPQGRFFTWLYRVAVNYCLNRIRRRKIVRMVPFRSFADRGDRGDRKGDTPAVLEPVDPGTDAHEALAAKHRWTMVRRAVANLPARQKVVLVLAKFEGLSYRQIADTLGISLGAVESRLFRAMQTLRQLENPETRPEKS